ncbi:AAA family ATPase [Bradyrhizobium sp. Ash2021]|uniref:AAA family ATPase n=1 Tax=Bradyrhizobium sp. Ash2021 TaxID=2954771 RepID=UPI0028150BC5|nr:AAA family ATPase [Bradyrhizobium sp. Ash2021]WMT72968.1 AAA family ATPase [Bradyrhizobium sp. Ash2021]
MIRKLDLAKNPEFLGQIGIRGSIARLLGWRKPETEATAIRYALESFQRKLSVKRVGLTYIVGVSFESADSEQAALILNTVAETYIAYQMDAKYNSTLRDETWIKNRLNELGSHASAAQKALEDYHKNRKDIASSANTVDAGVARSQSTAETQGELRDLVAAAESSTTALDNFRHVLRHGEAARQQSLPGFEARLVTEALPPLRASSPKGVIVLGIATVAGMLLGIAIGMLRDLSDRGIHTTGQVLRELQIACIAVVPRVKPDGVWRKLTIVFSGPAEKMRMKLASLESPVTSMRNGPVSNAMPSPDGERISKRSLSNRTSTDRARSRSIVRTENPIWTITDAPQSRFTESFLEIKLAIDTMNRSGKRNQVIGITSTQPNEGKSTVAAALALLMAHAGARVILVDCNLRNRSLSAALAPTAAFGILDVMTGAVSVSETTWTDSISELAFLPVGNNSRSIYASAVLTSEKLQKLFQTLREAYTYVIVDLPAVVPFADVRAAAHLLDSFILVVEPGRANIGVIERALKVCSDINELMLGVALNKADTNFPRIEGSCE